MNPAELVKDILQFPWVLRDYEHWLTQRPVQDASDYLFSQSRVRLFPHDDDQLTVPDTVSLVNQGRHVGIRVSDQSPTIPIPNIGWQHVESMLTSLREQPTVIELPLASQVPTDTCNQFLKLGFGQFIFAPMALHRLELQASAAEIVRWPGSPYEIVRNYWINVGHLHQSITGSFGTVDSRDAFVTWLRSLHVQLLLGPDLRTFYCPSSPIAQHRVAPGALYQVESRTLATPLGEFILEGPRVNATDVGGSTYHRLLDRSLGLFSPSSAPREFSISNARWGRLIHARSRSETQPRTWFLPPRPMRDEHWELLWDSWSRANRAIQSGDAAEASQHLGSFHWYFVHLHPFACANQSLAFVLINSALNRLVGSGIPHLVLDHLALRHERENYVQLFMRAVGAWATAEIETPARHLARVRMRRALDTFVAQLDAAKDDAEGNAMIGDNSEGARLALLVQD